MNNFAIYSDKEISSKKILLIKQFFQKEYNISNFEIYSSLSDIPDLIENVIIVNNLNFQVKIDRNEYEMNNFKYFILYQKVNKTLKLYNTEIYSASEYIINLIGSKKDCDISFKSIETNKLMTNNNQVFIPDYMDIFDYSYQDFLDDNITNYKIDSGCEKEKTLKSIKSLLIPIKNKSYNILNSCYLEIFYKKLNYENIYVLYPNKESFEIRRVNSHHLKYDNKAIFELDTEECINLLNGKINSSLVLIDNFVNHQFDKRYLYTI